MRFCCCFKQSKKVETCRTSSRHTPSPNAHWPSAIAYYRLRNLARSACVFHTTLLLPSAATCQLELKMPLPPAEKKLWKKMACIREIQVHKLWATVYSQNGLTAMYMYVYVYIWSLFRFYFFSILKIEVVMDGCLWISSARSIGQFNEAGLHEWMPFIIFHARSHERSWCHFQTNFWVGVASCCV